MSDAAARTWGQVVTGRFQDAVAAAIHGVLGSGGAAPAGPPPIPTPAWGRAIPVVFGVLAVMWLIRIALHAL